MNPNLIKRYKKAVILATLIGSGWTLPRSSVAQQDSAENPVASITEKLNSAFQKSDVSAIAGFLPPDTGQLYIAFDAASRKAKTARAAFFAALREQFQLTQKPAPAAFALEGFEKITVKGQRQISPTAIEVEWEFYWKQARQPLSRKVTLVSKAGTWKVQTPSGTPDELRKATDEIKGLIERYNTFAAKTESVTKEVRAGKYASPLAARAAWNQTARSSAAKE